MTLEEVVFQGIGEASMCWSETPKGVFDSENATRIGNEIMQAINAELNENATRIGNEIMQAINAELNKDDPGLPVKNPLPAKPSMPNPTEEDLHNPIFEAIWNVIRTWDVNVPEYYFGYCGANGSHVMLILSAIKGVQV